MKLFVPVKPPDLPRSNLHHNTVQLIRALEDVGHCCVRARMTAFTATPVSSSSLTPTTDASGYSAFVTLSLESVAPLALDAIMSCCRLIGLDQPLPVAEHVHTPEPLSISPTDVIRFGFIHRHPGLSAEEFRRHWIEHHAPLVMAHAPLFHRYVANVPLSGCAWDGIVEQWFVDEPTWMEHDRRIVEERPEVRADIARFVSGMGQYRAKPVDSFFYDRARDG